MRKICACLLALAVLLSLAPVALAAGDGHDYDRALAAREGVNTRVMDELLALHGVRELAEDFYTGDFAVLLNDGRVVYTGRIGTDELDWTRILPQWREMETIFTTEHDYTLCYGIDRQGVLHVAAPEGFFQGIEGWRDVAQLSDGLFSGCWAVTKDGRLLCSKTDPETNPLLARAAGLIDQDWTDLVQVEYRGGGSPANGQDLYGVRRDGTLLYFGNPYPEDWDAPAEISGSVLSLPGEQVERVWPYSFYLLILRRDGSLRVLETGESYLGDQPPYWMENWKDVAEIVSVDDDLTLALCRDGTVLFRAAPEKAEAYRGMQAWSKVLQLRYGYDHVAALCADGTVLAAGENDWGQCEVSGWRDVVKLYTGYRWTIGLTRDGEVLIAGLYEPYD